ncbi:MAG: hypothetical protein K8R53_08750 [Bacteroidales bacterium]|nr:hypothetical protein [Bacteroidales bacterium]
MKTKGYQGVIKKSAVVHSNDSENPKTRITLTAFIKTSISFDRWGVMLDGIVGQDIKKTVNFTANEDQPLTLEVETISLADKVSHELRRVEKGKKFQLVLSNISQKEDKYSGFITLKTNYVKKPKITIRILGYIREKNKPGNQTIK